MRAFLTLAAVIAAACASPGALLLDNKGDGLALAPALAR